MENNELVLLSLVLLLGMLCEFSFGGIWTTQLMLGTLIGLSITQYRKEQLEKKNKGDNKNGK